MAQQNYDELQQRYIAAIDEISYIGAQFAKRMGMTTEYDTAKNHMDNIICRVEGVLEDLELSRDDAEPEE
jgi:hypothetical protein